jgi:hypothetical protein
MATLRDLRDGALIATMASGLILYLTLPYVAGGTRSCSRSSASSSLVYSRATQSSCPRYSTAVGFCTCSARIITSFGPLVAGLLVGAFGGSFNRVTAFMTCFALLSIVAMLLRRETKGNPLPQ